MSKYALYAIGVLLFLLGIYTALEYGIFAHYILVCSFECIGGTHACTLVNDVYLASLIMMMSCMAPISCKYIITDILS